MTCGAKSCARSSCRNRDRCQPSTTSKRTRALGASPRTRRRRSSSCWMTCRVPRPARCASASSRKRCTVHCSVLRPDGYTLSVEHPWDRRLGVWYIAEDSPESPALVESPSGVTLTFGELAGRAHQLVHALRAHGIGNGDIVAYALPNDADILWWQYAMQEAGIQAIALNPAL